MYFAVVLLSLSITTSHCIQFANLTPEQLESIFGTTNVSNYDIVNTAYTTHDDTSESAIRVLQFTSFKKDIRLYLEPIYGFLAGKNTPIWTVKSDKESPLCLKYTQISKAMDDVIQVYQDTYNQAAITARTDKDGKIYFEGTIGDNVVLRRLPSELREESSRGKRNACQDDFPQRSLNRTVHHNNLIIADHHIIIEIPEMPINGMREKVGSYVIKKRSLRSKRETNVPITIFPEILVIVDYNIYLSFKSFIDFKQYILSFWNAVDLRYRVFNDPRIRLNIAGIVIPTDPNATPYLTNHRKENSNGIDIIDADKALDHAGRYLYNEMTNAKRLSLADNYDAVIIMTKNNLCNRIFTGDHESYDCSTLGYSFRGGACTVSTNESLVEAAGLVEDNAGYAGIVPTAHELGHLFGAPHDGYKESNKTICSPYDGYIMSRRLMFSENLFTWSRCSVENLKDFFHSAKAECLFDRPHVGARVPRILPGLILSLDEQCDRMKASYACNRDSTVCTRLDCFNKKTGTCIPTAPAAEGSQCGTNNYCINGKCTNTTTPSTLLSVPSTPVIII